VEISMSKKLDELRQRGQAYAGFREGYEARDALIRVGEMLSKARESSGLTQEALADRIGMKQSAISRLESGFGPHGPELDTVMRFVHGCDLELVVAVKSKGDSEKGISDRHGHEVASKLDLAKAYLDMGDPEGARNIIAEVLHNGSVAEDEPELRNAVFKTYI
jgi:FimV-like protein